MKNKYLIIALLAIITLAIFNCGNESDPPPETVTTPTATPPQGTYNAAQTVSLSTATSGAAIHYILYVAEPTLSSPVYSSPLVISNTTTMKAIDVKNGMNDSEVLMETYTIVPPPPTANARTDQTVTLSANLSVTLDGSASSSGIASYQ